MSDDLRDHVFHLLDELPEEARLELLKFLLKDLSEGSRKQLLAALLEYFHSSSVLRLISEDLSKRGFSVAADLEELVAELFEEEQELLKGRKN